MNETELLFDEIRGVLAPHGLFLRGLVGFAGDGPVLSDGGQARSVLLIGNVGGSLWRAFSHWRDENPTIDNPLDRWSEQTIRPIANRFGATAYFPSEKPWQPFQQWAMRAEGLKPSPLGILIHPEFGLWHGYRGALGFTQELLVTPTEPQPHPCETCSDRPCLTTCPVSAIASDHFDVAACRSHLRSVAGVGGCMEAGCLARNACPVGQDLRYPDAQLRFHMAALS
ncbi:ferredoxin [Rhizobium alvei]|uniref:Ferredoxin n=1 Tax=Rhizobium alvei TaxID=1132659 RepID=A0ABT8YI19_9HYPH|nr:ferredoxin [Rhizobium alvei]MDO6963312.1 ferredoxin [Rhizobium alvei]